MKHLTLEEIIEQFKALDKFGSLLGAKVLSLTKDECVFEYNVKPEHFNPNGVLHGGVLFGVIDSSQGLFIHYILDPAFKAATTGTATIKYLAPVTSGKVKIRTYLKEVQNRKYFINSVVTDESEKEVATAEEIWIAFPK